MSHLKYTHRVTNKVTIETGFSCNPTIKESNEGREGGAQSRGGGGGACF